MKDGVKGGGCRKPFRWSHFGSRSRCTSLQRPAVKESRSRSSSGEREREGGYKGQSRERQGGIVTTDVLMQTQGDKMKHLLTDTRLNDQLIYVGFLCNNSLLF